MRTVFACLFACLFCLSSVLHCGCVFCVLIDRICNSFGFLYVTRSFAIIYILLAVLIESRVCVCVFFCLVFHLSFLSLRCAFVTTIAMTL